MKRKKIWQKTHITLYKNGWCYLLTALFCSIPVVCPAQDSDSTYEADDTVATEASGYNGNSNDTGNHYPAATNFFNHKDSVGQPYTGTKMQSRISAADAVDKLKAEDDFWYVKSIEKFKSSAVNVQYDKAYKDSLAATGNKDNSTQQFSEEETGSFQLPYWAAVIIWGVIIAVFLFAVVYFLTANKINIFSRSSAGGRAGTDDEVVDLFATHYTDMLQKAYAEKNYRLAVRILYLQTLKMLSEKNIIHFKADYTNLNYLQQLSSTMFYKDFFVITRHYEYVWYGGFGVSEGAFDTIKNDFAQIQNKVLHG